MTLPPDGGRSQSNKSEAQEWGQEQDADTSPCASINLGGTSIRILRNPGETVPF